MFLKKIIIFGLVIIGLVVGIRYCLNSGALDNYLDTHTDLPSTPKIEYKIGQLQMVFGDTEKAVSRFKKILKQYPETKWAPKARFSIAKVYDQNGLTRPAINEYTIYMNLYPKGEDFEKARIRVQYLR